jgi:hemerythrin superfamily protein
MDALSLLKKQHREVEELFQKAKSAEGPEKLQYFLQLADDLATHATIEEKVFYPGVLSGKTEDELLEAVQEHLQMKRILADMLDMEVSDERFDAKLKVLEDEVSHHVEEEEGQLFKDVAKEIDADVLERLGQEMESLAMMLRDSEPREEIPRETREAPPLQTH